MARMSAEQGKHFKEDPSEEENNSEQGSGQKERSFKRVRFGRLAFQALPEMWSYQMLASIIMGVQLALVSWLYEKLMSSANMALTSANIFEVFLSWRGPIILLLGAAALMVVMVPELFGVIILCDDILCGRKAHTLKTLRRGFLSLKRFMTPFGILILLYVLFAAPLCGIGFSVSTTSNLYIPHFISEVIFANRIYTVLYVVVMGLLAIIGFSYLFVIHGVLIDDLTPAEAGRQSVRIIRENWRRFLGTMALVFLSWGVAMLVTLLLIEVVPSVLVEDMGLGVDKAGYNGLEILKDNATMTDAQVEYLLYRALCCFVAIFGIYTFSLVTLLASSYIILRFTRCYREYVHEEKGRWPERPRRHVYVFKVLGMVGMTIVIAGISLLIAFFFENLFPPYSAHVVGHRAAGKLGPENSLEGLEVAIEHQCYGSEIDVQRTSDGYYVINHDNTFRRLSGDTRAPQEMTFDEVRSLKLKDTTGSGKTLQVATLEEMLDVIKDREILFVELKGATADKQMVDDVVAMVREKDCVDDVVLISLNYDTIRYAEETYPEFETGVLIFVGFGNVSRLECDYVLMEEEVATGSRLNDLHAQGKKTGVWTVNTQDGMRSIMLRRPDVIITDEILLAQQVQEELDARSDYQILRDVFSLDS